VGDSDGADHDKDSIKCERCDWSISLIHRIEMDAEETKTKLEKTKDHAEEKVEGKETIRYCSEESPSIIHSDEHTIKEEDLVARDDEVKDDVKDPSKTENGSKDTKNKLNPTHNNRTTGIRMKQFKHLVLLIDDIHTRTPLVVCLTLLVGPAARTTPAGIAEFLTPVDEFDSLVVDDSLLLIVSTLAECVRTRDEAPEEIIRNRGKTDTAKDDQDEVSDEIDDGDKEEDRANTEGHIARTSAALSRATVHGWLFVLKEETRVETNDGNLRNTKEDIGNSANCHKDANDDEDCDERGSSTLDSAHGTAASKISDIVLMPDEKEGEDDDSKDTDEAVGNQPQ